MSAGDMFQGVVYLVDDDPSMLKMLSALTAVLNVSVRAHASAKEFLDGYRAMRSQCLVCDIRMPEIDGMALQQRLNAMHAVIPIIFLTGFAEVGVAVEAMRQGAFDFLEKPFSKSDLMAALKAAGRAGEQPVVTSHEQQKAEEQIAHLTNREREVLIGLVQGHLNKQIAYDLDISPRTVEVHRANVMKKLGVHSLSEMLQIAFLAGYSRLPDKAAG